MTDDRPAQPEDIPSGPAATGPTTGPTPGPTAGPTPDPGNPGAGQAGFTAAAEPPPLTAFAWRNGLVRPTRGRLLAGVCGALARATNTDPILWRVIIAVLTIFGGFGVLAYLLGWLLLPADGDTASPVESLLGRGQSATSSTLTVIAGVIALLSVGAFVSEPFRPGILGAVLLGAAVLLLLRDQRGRTRPGHSPAWPHTAGQTPGPSPVGPTTGPHPTAAYTPGAAPMWSTPAGPTPPGDTDPYGSGAPAGPGYPSQAPPYPSAPPYPTPPPAFGTPPLFGAQPPSSTQQPFAPRGPFAPGALPPQPPPPRRFTPPSPRPRQPRSKLGRLTFSLLLVVIGALIAIDLGLRPVPTNAYLAAALATVALGLIIGTWFGRARGLIAVGIVLSVALTSVAGASHIDRGWRGGEVTWAPISVSQLESSYGQDVGDLRLDLTKVDFATTTDPIALDVRVDVGSVTLILPPNVDVVIDAKVNVGNADVLGQSWNGLGLEARTVEDNGADGSGGGMLHISARVDLGNLEVSR